MKPLSELRDSWQRQASVVRPTEEQQAADFHFNKGRQYCAAELQAWLREADAWVCQDRQSWQPSQTWGVGPIVEDIRRELLGTMRLISKNGD